MLRFERDNRAELSGFSTKEKCDLESRMVVNQKDITRL